MEKTNDFFCRWVQGAFMYLAEIVVVLLLVAVGMFIATTVDPLDPGFVLWDEDKMVEREDRRTSLTNFVHCRTYRNGLEHEICGNVLVTANKSAHPKT